ncbi:MAG: dihydrolipoyl dehydrogenase [Burkholderiales bacterium]|nr:dihydrolipoyl dehydrogenase [Burkholderiales bacterium]
MPQAFDVVVIGGGPGGYVAAIRAAQLGFKTACIDNFKNAAGKPSLGGTCLNVGCIPSKALLESSENFERVRHKFGAHGIAVTQARIDVATMLARKQKIVDQFTGGIAGLFRKNKVASLHGTGAFKAKTSDGYTVEVTDAGKTEAVQGKHVVVATGSVPRALPFAPFDNDAILDNAGALALSEVPKRLGVIGAGVIGLEMGSVWRRLGSEVTLLEALPGFLQAADEAVAKEALKVFTRELGLVIRTGVQVTRIEQSAGQMSVGFAAEGKDEQAEFDRVIVAVGRAPNTAGLGAEAVGLDIDARGFVAVDAHCRTNLANVFAIGDVVRGPMLAHKAMEEGVAVAERIAGQAAHVNLDHVPWVIYTSPEIAWVGRTEQSLREAGVRYRAGQFPFMANGRARALGEPAGFVKMLADEQTDRILGVHIIGPFASELISEAVVAMEFDASSEDIARIVHAHPSLAEVMHEAALAVDKRTLHI